MQLATVLGQVVSTIKGPGLDRFTLLLVQDVSGADLEGVDGAAYVAVDLVVSGSAARVAAGTDAPTDRTVVAIADSVIRAGTVTYRKA
jgi:ethanolamine utilization protein EutN